MAEIKDRLTVTETVYHQPFGEEPSGAETRFSRDLKTHEQLYERRCLATEQWKPLDCGWLQAASMLLIVNTEGQNLQANPTDAEREETAGKVLEIVFATPNRTMHDLRLAAQWLIPPKESMRAQPADVSQLRIRCRKGEAHFLLYLFPE